MSNILDKKLGSELSKVIFSLEIVINIFYSALIILLFGYVKYILVEIFNESLEKK